MSKIFSFSLYYTSFAPLWLSILFIDIKSCIENIGNLWTEKLSIGCILIFGLLSVIVLMVSLCLCGKEGTTSYCLKNVQEDKSITAEYLLSYILPLFAFDFTQWDQVLLFLIFFLTLGFLCIRHNYFSVNIILEVVNFRFYNFKVENDDGVIIEQRIISHRRLSGCIGDTLYLKALNNEYKLDIQQ